VYRPRTSYRPQGLLWVFSLNELRTLKVPVFPGCQLASHGLYLSFRWGDA
jgi:hypothetical protein